jgi:hypothetical protein
VVDAAAGDCSGARGAAAEAEAGGAASSSSS